MRLEAGPPLERDRSNVFMRGPYHVRVDAQFSEAYRRSLEELAASRQRIAAGDQLVRQMVRNAILKLGQRREPLTRISVYALMEVEIADELDDASPVVAQLIRMGIRDYVEWLFTLLGQAGLDQK